MKAQKWDSKEDRKHKVLRQLRRGTGAVADPFVNIIFISFEGECFSKHVVHELVVIYEIYIRKVTEEFGAVRPL